MRRMLAPAAFAALMLCGGVSMAQEGGAAGMGGVVSDLEARFDERTVTPEAPFGNLAIDLTADADLKAQFSMLSTAQQDELRARCLVILDNEEDYAPEAVAACETTGEIAD